MKKFLKLALISLMALSLVACSKEAPKETGTPETTPVAGECAVTVGLVTDIGGVDDKSFNQSAWEGVLQFQKDNNLADECVSYLQSAADADYVPNLSTFGDNGVDIVMAVGFLFENAINEVAPNYPDTKFLFVDVVSPEANVMSAIYAAEQGSFLVGVAAGLKALETESNAVGFIGGMESEIIGAFQAGFEQGVLAANPEATIYVDYVDSFADDSKAQNLAVKQYDAGASVIYQSAGNAGNGVIKEAKQRGDVWVVGVDRDQYEDGMTAEGNSVILTSMIKRVDSATYKAAELAMNNEFIGGITTFDLTNEGIGAELTTGRNLSDDVIATVADYAAKIKSGEIVVTIETLVANGQSNKTQQAR